MPFRKKAAPERNGDRVDDAPGEPTSTADALALAEEAEAEAAEAEAAAVAARARAKALRLRREADAAGEKAATEKAAREKEADDKDAAAKDAVGKDAAETTAATPKVLAAPADVEPAEKDADDETEKDDADDAAEIDDAAETEGAVEIDEAGGDESATEKPAKKRRRLRVPMPSWRVAAAAVTVLLIAALLAVSGYMYWFHRQAQAELERRAEFNAAARQGVVILMSLDYTHAKEDVQRIIDNSTGQFKDDFQNTADDFIKVAQDSKAVTETTVTASAVDSMSDDTATVIVAAKSKVTNAAGAKQEPRAWRLSVNMTRDGDQLKMSKVEFVP
ncbi:hypothetical protein DVS77_10715 [Mycolicibacterium moriokaense]|nr:hypothetical protein DVS77_10715 [Mycolicibacterium moriokaense]